MNKYMKYSILYIFLVLATVLSSAAQPKKKNQKVVIQTTIFCDHCKACETCGQKFQTEIKKIKGVKMYELNEKKMQLTVYYNGEKTDSNAIKTAISKMGYDADEIKADATAYEQLDDCCKKK